MVAILGLFSEAVLTIIKQYFESRAIPYTEMTSVTMWLEKQPYKDPIQMILIEYQRDNLEFINLAEKLRIQHQMSEIICLFDIKDLSFAPDYVNRKIVNGIGSLPRTENEFHSLISPFMGPRKALFQIMDSISDKDYVIKDLLSMEYIYDLIYGNFSRIRMLNEITLLMGLERVPQFVLTVMCDNFWNVCESMDNRERYKIKRKILNVVRNAVENTCRAVASTLIGTDKIIVLLDCAPAENEEAEDIAYCMANNIRQMIKEKTIYTVTVGISGYCRDYKNLWKAYDQSFRALSYAFKKGDDSVIKHNEIEVKDSSEDLYKINQFEQNLIRSISKPIHKFEQDQQLMTFSDLCKMMTISNYNPEIIKSIIIKTFLGVVQYCYNVGVDFNRLSSVMNDFMVEILKTNSIKNIEIIGERVLSTMAFEVQELRNTDRSIMMHAANAYIEKYFNLDLTLDEVADVSNISRYHFSRLFKNYNGVNFIQYLTKIRIEKAKQLLIESDATLEAISEKVGYHEVAYFCRIFKKIEGTTPRQFKKKSQ